MKTFKVTILGSLAALPHKGKITSAQIVHYGKNAVHIDCGEGTQMMMAKYQVHTSDIRLICISHLHGDHLFGLPGLLASFQHRQRTDLLTITGPTGIAEYTDTIIRLTQLYLTYPLQVIELSHVGKREVFHLGDLGVYAFPLNHRIPTYGFCFEEVLLLKRLKKEAVELHHLSVEEIRLALKGKDVVRGEEVLENRRFILPDPEIRRYAYCSDTVYDEKIIPWINGVSTLYHESTYLHDLVEKATERKHSTSRQAGVMAKKANVKHLLLGHFSFRYTDLNPLMEEAKKEFENVSLATEGSVFFIS